VLSIKNRKLPAWVGSIILHALLVLFFLYWFAPGPDKGVPWERTATGILVQSGGGARESGAEAAQNDETKLTAVETETLSTVNPSELPPILAPGQHSHNVQNTGGGSANEISESLGTGGGAGGVGGGQGEAVVPFFGTKGKGTKFVFVLDRSASMDGAPLRKAKAELIKSVNALDNLHQFNIIIYNTTFESRRSGVGPRLIYATDTEKRGAEKYINGITAVGGTGHYEPLMRAIRHRPDVIFFLTDGESKDDLTAVQLEAIERENSFGRGAQINVIQFGSGGLTDSESRSLQRLAEQNHGDYEYYNVTGWK
jgi:hypothetical protein